MVKRYAGLIIIVVGILLMVGVFQIILKPGRHSANIIAPKSGVVK